MAVAAPRTRPAAPRKPRSASSHASAKQARSTLQKLGPDPGKKSARVAPSRQSPTGTAVNGAGQGARKARSSPGLRPKSNGQSHEAAAAPKTRAQARPAPNMAPEDESVLKLDPARLWELQQEYTRSIANLWTEMLEGKDHVPPSDKRFGSTAWQGLHAYLAEVYVLNARFMTKLAESIEAGPKMRAKVRFAINQWVDAMSPANFLATNPEAQQKILATQGQSLSASLGNLMADLQKGRISQTDESAFQIGRNVATTPGAVIFQNEIFQLLQYAPTTETVFERPLLIVPPCINKYYILDLQPENSFVAHAVAQGHTVYVISWRNPTPSQAALSWDDYIAEGVIRAIHLAQELSKQKQINVLGFCIGGTLTATALSVLRARGEDAVASVTLLTTLLDFSDTGVLGVFVDEQQVRMREQSLGGQTRKGVKAISPHLMPGRELAASFSFLRPNELVWNYVVNNYLKGEAPPPFDLLYWNADSTNLPGPFFVWYLRNTYLEDKLKVPGALKVCGKPVDLGAIRVPAYVYASREDHIVPWNTAFASTRLLKGPTRFVLGASGHIAGVINPPEKNKRNYWAVPADGGPARVPEDPDEWFSLAKEIAGSWWPDWYAWLAPFGGRRIPAPKKPGDAHHKPLEKAPGSYVVARAE